jgi:hypothetical protein
MRTRRLNTAAARLRVTDELDTYQPNREIREAGLATMSVYKVHAPLGGYAGLVEIGLEGNGTERTVYVPSDALVAIIRTYATTPKEA